MLLTHIVHYLYDNVFETLSYKLIFEIYNTSIVAMHLRKGHYNFHVFCLDGFCRGNG